MLKYTLCLIKQGHNILLLNRERAAWMGCWNGIGGKIEKGENPRESMLREIYEETAIESKQVSTPIDREMEWDAEQLLYYE